MWHQYVANVLFGPAKADQRALCIMFSQPFTTNQILLVLWQTQRFFATTFGLQFLLFIQLVFPIRGIFLTVWKDGRIFGKILHLEGFSDIFEGFLNILAIFKFILPWKQLITIFLVFSYQNVQIPCTLLFLQ